MLRMRPLTVCMLLMASASLLSNLWMRQDQHQHALTATLDEGALAAASRAAIASVATQSRPQTSVVTHSRSLSDSQRSEGLARAAAIRRSRQIQKLKAERSAKSSPVPRDSVDAAPPPPPSASQPLSQPPLSSAAASPLSNRTSQPSLLGGLPAAAATRARRASSKQPTRQIARAAAAATARQRQGGGGGGIGGVAAMDTEDGVRLGSKCADEAIRPVGKMACPTASDIIDELRAAAAAADTTAAQPGAADADAATGTAGAGAAPPPRAKVCLYTALTDAYLEGHLVFVRSAQRHTPCMRRARPAAAGAAGGTGAASAAAAATIEAAEDREGPPPMYVLDQALSGASRQRVEASYRDVRWVATELPEQSYASKRLTKFALNKEKVALFRLGSACDAVLKIDSGDMLVTADLTPLLRTAPGQSVWATQALGQPTAGWNRRPAPHTAPPLGRGARFARRSALPCHSRSGHASFPPHMCGLLMIASQAANGQAQRRAHALRSLLAARGHRAGDGGEGGARGARAGDLTPHTSPSHALPARPTCSAHRAICARTEPLQWILQ